MTTGVHRRGLLVALVAGTLAIGGTGAVAQSGKAATAAALAPGQSVGTVTVGSTTVPLAHAYVAGPTSDLYVVELTDRPIPEDALAAELRRGGGQGLLRSGKVQGMLLYVSDKGFVVTAIPFVGELRGEKMLGSVGSLDTFTIAAGLATGAGSITGEKSNQGWSYQARFAAQVRPIK